MRQTFQLLMLVALIPFILGIARADVTWSRQVIAETGPEVELNFVVQALVRLYGVGILPYVKATSILVAMGIAALVGTIARFRLHGKQRAAAIRAANLIIIVAAALSLFLLCWWMAHGAIARGWIE